MELEHEGRRFTVPGWIGPHIAELLAKGEKAAAPKQQAVDKETLVAFERVFWKAVELSGSRDFDHDVCKEVRDFRSLLAALPGKTEVGRG